MIDTYMMFVFSKGREPGAKGASHDPIPRHTNVPALAPKALMRYCSRNTKMYFCVTTSENFRDCFSKGRESGAKGASQEPIHRHTNVPALANAVFLLPKEINTWLFV